MGGGAVLYLVCPIRATETRALRGSGRKPAKEVAVKLIRKRRPSVKSMLGVTKAKKAVKRATGITAVTKPLRAPTNLKRTVNSGRAINPSRLGGFAGSGAC